MNHALVSSFRRRKHVSDFFNLHKELIAFFKTKRLFDLAALFCRQPKLGVQIWELF
jgi:hypothetical protein